MTCKHRETHPEGAEWPIEDSLEHFDQCLAPERRVEAWGWMREDGARARRCLVADHDGLLDELRWSHNRIVELTREIASRPHRQAARVAYRARARRRTRRNR